MRFEGERYMKTRILLLLPLLLSGLVLLSACAPEVTPDNIHVVRPFGDCISTGGTCPGGCRETKQHQSEQGTEDQSSRFHDWYYRPTGELFQPILLHFRIKRRRDCPHSLPENGDRSLV